MSRSLAGRVPTYPMIPHIRRLLAFGAWALSVPGASDVVRPGLVDVRPKARLKHDSSAGTSAELPLNECGDATTGLFGHLRVLGLDEDADRAAPSPTAGRARGPSSPSSAFDALDRRRGRPGSAPCDATRTFSFACAKRGITAAASLSVRPSQRGAEEQRRREPVAGDVVAQADHVPRLLAAEHAALAPERLEHVAVADVGRDDADPALAPSACGSRGSSSA